MTTLSVVMPVYNEREKIERTVRSVERAAEGAPFDVEVVVVDDGSTDGTGDAARQLAATLPVHVHSQPNRGRLAARRAGLGRARGEYVLLLDAGAELVEGSLRFLARQLELGPERGVWNGHTIMGTEGDRFEEFWSAVSRIAFADYVSNPRTTAFDLETFDRYPKGAGCFFAPRALLAEAFDHHTSYYADPRHASDDTAPFRWLVMRSPINISPEFAFVYRYEETPLGFVRHALHRGVVFLDGHGRRSSRFFPLVVAFYPLSLVAGGLATRRPWALAALGGALAAGGAATALSRGSPRREAVSFGLLAPAYAAAHGAGMWWGLWLALRGRVAASR